MLGLGVGVIMKPSLILHSVIYGEGIQFHRISTAVQNYFDALPCFYHVINAK